MKIGLIGYGKMGKTIEGLANHHDVVLRVGKNDQQSNWISQLDKVDVAIEFSHPEAAFENIKACLEAGVPVVSGTTGWLKRYDELCSICQFNKGAFLYASNFSIGVNIFFELNKTLAKMMNALKEYDVDIHEIHHTQKLDAPSGTGISLAEGVLGELDRKEQWESEHLSAKENLLITSAREGNTPGTHIVSYTSDIDKLVIRHEAKGRIGFAKGALQAAEWLLGKQGVFGMKDMLNIS